MTGIEIGRASDHQRAYLKDAPPRTLWVYRKAGMWAVMLMDGSTVIAKRIRLRRSRAIGWGIEANLKRDGGDIRLLIGRSGGEGNTNG